MNQINEINVFEEKYTYKQFKSFSTLFFNILDATVLQDRQGMLYLRKIINFKVKNIAPLHNFSVA